MIDNHLKTVVDILHAAFGNACVNKIDFVVNDELQTKNIEFPNYQ